MAASVTVVGGQAKSQQSIMILTSEQGNGWLRIAIHVILLNLCLHSTVAGVVAGKVVDVVVGMVVVRNCSGEIAANAQVKQHFSVIKGVVHSLNPWPWMTCWHDKDGHRSASQPKIAKICYWTKTHSFW